MKFAEILNTITTTDMTIAEVGDLLFAALMADAITLEEATLLGAIAAMKAEG